MTLTAVAAVGPSSRAGQETARASGPAASSSTPITPRRPPSPRSIRSRSNSRAPGAARSIPTSSGSIARRSAPRTALRTSPSSTAAPDAGSAFAGWGGDARTRDGADLYGHAGPGAQRRREPRCGGPCARRDPPRRRRGGSRDPDDRCGSMCGANLRQATVVVLTATPILGATFIGWGSDCSGTGVCQLTMDGDHGSRRRSSRLPGHRVAGRRRRRQRHRRDPNRIVCGAAAPRATSRARS